MTMARRVWICAFVVLLSVGMSWAQVFPPNEKGVSMGHLLFIVKDIEVNKKFWIAVGGAPARLGPMDVVKFPGVMILFQQGEPSGGTVGSTVAHVGFQVPNLQAAVAKWEAAGLKTLPGHSAQQCYVPTPDGLTNLEMLEDPSLKMPIAFQQVHFYLAESGPNPGTTAQIEDWYVKIFGAKPSTFLTAKGEVRPGAADLPGVSLRFAKSDTPTVGTKGRTLDHIGFEIKNLKAFCKKARANGVKFESPYEKQPEFGISRAYVTDPWGTRIELTEGMGRL
jgi:catechol 2,3-dioxygenase-like lactoylglutathione lyase family enzyme